LPVNIKFMYLTYLYNRLTYLYFFFFFFFCTGLGAIISDLPQGNKLAGVKNFNGRFGCRLCLIASDKYEDTGFDHILHARYHQITKNLLVQLRLQPVQATACSFAQEHGLSMNYWKTENPIEQLIFDPHLQIPLDPAHVILQNLDRILIETTCSLFSRKGENHFRSILYKTKLPRGWSRFQDPIAHISSYFFSDCARLIMIGPTLICELVENDISPSALDDLRKRLGFRRNSQVLDAILDCWKALAKLGAVAFRLEQSHQELDTVLHESATVLLRVSIELLLFKVSNTVR